MSHKVRQIGGKRCRSRHKLACTTHKSTAITVAWEMQILPAALNASRYLNYMLNLLSTGHVHSSAAFACAGSSVGIGHHCAWYLSPELVCWQGRLDDAQQRLYVTGRWQGHTGPTLSSSATALFLCVRRSICNEMDCRCLDGS